METNKTVQNRNSSSVKSGGEYVILTKQNELALQVSDGSVVLSAPNGSVSQRWKLKKIAGGAYKILSCATGEAIDIMYGALDSGVWVHVWEDIGASTQEWSVRKTKDGSAYVVLSKPANKCLDVVGISAVEGNHVQIWEDVKGENQQWIFVSVGEPEEKPVKKPAAKKPAAKKTAVKSSKAAEKKAAPIAKAEPAKIVEKKPEQTKLVEKKSEPAKIVEAKAPKHPGRPAADTKK